MHQEDCSWATHGLKAVAPRAESREDEAPGKRDIILYHESATPLHTEIDGPEAYRRPVRAGLECVPIGLWRSLAARLLWEQEVVGSNPTSPTITSMRQCSTLDRPRPPVGYFQ